MKSKLSRIRSPWRRRLVSLFISLLILIGKCKSPRARAHWLGNASRPPRPERLLFVVLVILPPWVLEPVPYLHWSLLWGLFFSLFVILESVRKIAPRRKYHWLG